MPFSPATRSRRDSWPPTQVRLVPTSQVQDGDDSIEDIDDDPLTYFLTPAPALDTFTGDIDMIDFDAGIEDPNNAHEIVRSVSPSSLDGLRRSTGRQTSPDRDLSELATPEDVLVADDEDYIRFQPGSAGLPFNLNDLALDGVKLSRPQVMTRSKSGPPLKADSLLSPVPLHTPTSRGRTSARGHGQGRTRSLSARRRPQHLWREPSPDVWSIEEETEEELNSETGSPIAGSDRGDYLGAKEKTHKTLDEIVDVSAAKPKKKVRFLLPARR